MPRLHQRLEERRILRRRPQPAREPAAKRAVKMMRQHAIRRLPVVENGNVLGMVSIGDLAVKLDRRSALSDISAAPANQ